MQPRFCIVTPSYNTGRFLGKCVQSVLAQAGCTFDYLVMDGGSNDDSVDILRSFGPRLKWVSGPDGGQSAAINTGFARTGRGDPDEVLAWLNSDDVYLPGTFQHVADIFARRPELDVVYGKAAYIDAFDRHVADCVHIEPFDRRRLVHISDFMVQPATFFRRRAFDRVGGLTASLNWMMDWDLWVRMALAGLQFEHTRRPLAHFRWLTDNKTANGGAGRLDEIDSTFIRYGLPPPAYVQLERCNLHLVDAAKELSRGRLPSAAAALRRIYRTLARSRPAVASLFDIHTWHVIWVGQILRARAAAADRRFKQTRGF